MLCEVLGCRNRVPEDGRKILAWNSPPQALGEAELGRGFQESHYTRPMKGEPVYSGFIEPRRS